MASLLAVSDSPLSTSMARNGEKHYSFFCGVYASHWRHAAPERRKLRDFRVVPKNRQRSERLQRLSAEIAVASESERACFPRAFRPMRSPLHRQTYERNESSHCHTIRPPRWFVARSRCSIKTVVDPVRLKYDRVCVFSSTSHRYRSSKMQHGLDDRTHLLQATGDGGIAVGFRLKVTRSE